MSTRLGLRVALLMTVPPLLWAGNAVLGRVLVGEVPPLTLNALRWGIAGLLLLPLGWRVLRAPGELLRRWKHLLLLVNAPRDSSNSTISCAYMNSMHR